MGLNICPNQPWIADNCASFITSSLFIVESKSRCSFQLLYYLTSSKNARQSILWNIGEWLNSNVVNCLSILIWFPGGTMNLHLIKVTFLGLGMHWHLVKMLPSSCLRWKRSMAIFSRCVFIGLTYSSGCQSSFPAGYNVNRPSLNAALKIL